MDQSQGGMPQEHASEKMRSFSGAAGAAVTAVLVVWAAFQLWANTFASLGAVKLRAAHILFLLVLTFVLYPADCRRMKDRVPVWDLALAALAAGAILYAALTAAAYCVSCRRFEKQDI